MFSYSQAVRDFENARRKAALEEILGRLSGKSNELVSFDEIRQRLRSMRASPAVLREIPLNAIVGSVSRETDFTRTFLPRRESDRARWANVKMAQEQLAGLPPIEVYQVGEVYFVLDGHHRVSVVRQLGGESIQAYVTIVSTEPLLSPTDSPDELILKTEKAAFLSQTHFDDLRPGEDLRVSAPGRYPVLLEHIAVHHYFMGLDQRRDVSYAEAVTDWYDNYYLPVVRTIRGRNLLADFPDRTETDLYLWLTEHRSALAEELDWEISEDDAARDLARRFPSRPMRVLANVYERIWRWLMPDFLEDGPQPGEWRRERIEKGRPNRLFDRVMVALTYHQDNWGAVDVALQVAQYENAWLGGLLVIKEESEKESEAARALRSIFEQRCMGAQIQGKMVVEVSDQVAPIICQRSYWTDLTVIKLRFPPPLRFLQRMNSGMRLLVQRCPSPLLVVPDGAPPLNHILLAYDASPKANEALYVAAYLTGRWGVKLTVLTAMKDFANAVDKNLIAREYLEEQGVDAEYIQESGNPAEHILRAVAQRNAGLILMGGYSARPLRELLKGSTVDRVLMTTRVPVMICR